MCLDIVLLILHSFVDFNLYCYLGKIGVII